MTSLVYRRLTPAEPSHVAEFQRVFRGTPSFVYPTAGRTPTDAEAEAVMRTLPTGREPDDVFIHAISTQGELCGCSFVVRAYPNPETAYLVLLMFMESAQGKSFGTQALRDIRAEAKSWGCSSLDAVVDSKNERALRFWLREGFVERYRRDAAGFIGQAVAISKNGI